MNECYVLKIDIIQSRKELKYNQTIIRTSQNQLSIKYQQII